MLATKKVRVGSKISNVELRRFRWCVENFTNGDILMNQCESGKSLYINRCINTVVTVPNKINNLTINNCCNCVIRIAGSVAGCEIVNSKIISIMARDTVPTLQVDLSDGVEIFLTPNTVFDTKIINSNTANVYLNAVMGSTSEQIIRYQIPSSLFMDQYVTYLDKNCSSLKTVNAATLKQSDSPFLILPKLYMYKIFKKKKEYL